MHRRLFLKIQIVIADKRTEQKPVAHHRRDIPERILLDVQFIAQKVKDKLCRFIFLHLDLEILLERFLRCIHTGNSRIIDFSGKRVKLFIVLARERPNHHVIGFVELERKHGRNRVLEPLAIQDKLMPLQFISETKFFQRLGILFTTTCPRKIFQHGAAIHQKRHHQRQIHPFTVGIHQEFHRLFLKQINVFL